MSYRRALMIVWEILTPRQRKALVLLQFVSVFMAMSTVVGLAAIMPFFAALADPAALESHAALNWLRQALHVTTQRDLLVMLGGGFIVLLVLGAVVNLCGSFAMGRFAFAVGDRVREVLFAEYLRRDYLFHVRAGAGRLMNDVLYQADRIPVTLLNGLVLVTNAILVLLVVASIAWVNPSVAVTVVVIVTGSYALFYRVVRRRVARNGSLQSQLNAMRIAVVDQAFRGIKYLLISQTQQAIRKRFAGVTHTLSRSIADTQFIAQSPRYVLECVAGAALIASAAFMTAGSAGVGSWLAQLSFVGLAGFRLLPACQQIYNSLVVMRNNRHSVGSIAVQLEAAPRTPMSAPGGGGHQPVTACGAIELKDVSYRYSPESPLVLDEARLRIPAGAALGIVGASGCGKTTLADLILGLLVPTGGRIEIDGQPLGPARMAAWQQSIGYVPQDAVFVNASVRENIAFGVDPAGIDDALVREVASQAGASGFIEALPGGYSAIMPDVGGALSGGQRQRIAIARALYRRPALLVLDEATNSLDTATECAIIETVVHNRGTRTLLIIAHGAAVIGACDRVCELRGGTLRELEPAHRAVAEAS